LECPLCDRTWFYETFKKRNLHEVNIEHLVNFVGPNADVNMCGNNGDPIYHSDFPTLCQRLKNNNCKLSITTNGSAKTKKWWNELNAILDNNDTVTFSIDGLEDTNHLYRRNVNWQKIMENSKAFITTGASAHWDMLVFKHNKHQVAEAKSLADEMKFTWFRAKETDRWDTYNTDLGISPADKYTPASYGKDIVCEKDRDQSIFLDYTGKFWPCCHMAEAYLNQIGLELHKDIRMHDNESLFKEYSTRLDNQKPFYICKRACGVNTGKRSQWKTEEQLR